MDINQLQAMGFSEAAIAWAMRQTQSPDEAMELLLVNPDLPGAVNTGNNGDPFPPAGVPQHQGGPSQHHGGPPQQHGGPSQQHGQQQWNNEAFPPTQWNNSAEAFFPPAVIMNHSFQQGPPMPGCTQQQGPPQAHPRQQGPPQIQQGTPQGQQGPPQGHPGQQAHGANMNMQAANSTVPMMPPPNFGIQQPRILGGPMSSFGSDVYISGFTNGTQPGLGITNILGMNPMQGMPPNMMPPNMLPSGTMPAGGMQAMQQPQGMSQPGSGMSQSGVRISQPQSGMAPSPSAAMNPPSIPPPSTGVSGVAPRLNFPSVGVSMMNRNPISEREIMGAGFLQGLAANQSGPVSSSNQGNRPESVSQNGNSQTSVSQPIGASQTGLSQTGTISSIPSQLENLPSTVGDNATEDLDATNDCEDDFVSSRQRELEEMEKQLETMERELEDLANKHNDMLTANPEWTEAQRAANANAGDASGTSGLSGDPGSGERALWKVPNSEETGENKSWEVTKKPGTHLIALDLHRCLLYPCYQKPESILQLKPNMPSCASCGCNKDVKWGCDICNVAFCAHCTRPYEFNPAPVEVANSEWKWYRTIITTRIVDEDHMTLCKLPTDFRVLVRPMALKSKRGGAQKMKSRWEIISPIRGIINPQKLAFDHFPFRYLHDQQYVKKTAQIEDKKADNARDGALSIEDKKMTSSAPSCSITGNLDSNIGMDVCQEVGAEITKPSEFMLVNPNSKNYNSALGSSKTAIISSLPLPLEISELPYHRCYQSNLYACFLPKGFKVYHRQGPRGCAATHISGGCRRPWKRRDAEESQAALAYYCPLCEILLCSACAFDPKLCEKTDAAMKRDLDELTVGPPSIRLASLGRLRSSVETNWAEILTHIALDLGDKLGVCMLHKDERLVKEAMSFAILVVAWLSEDEERSVRPWGRVRPGDIAIAPKIQDHVVVTTAMGGLALKPSKKKKITISDPIDYPGRPEELKKKDLDRKAEEEKLAKKVLWNDALVSRVVKSQAGMETVCVVGSFRQCNGAYVRNPSEFDRPYSWTSSSAEGSSSEEITNKLGLNISMATNQIASDKFKKNEKEKSFFSNLAGAWGDNNAKLKKMKSEKSPRPALWEFPFNFSRAFDNSCQKRQGLLNGDLHWTEAMPYLDTIVYSNKESKTKLTGYFIPDDLVRKTPGGMKVFRKEYDELLGLGHANTGSGSSSSSTTIGTRSSVGSTSTAAASTSHGTVSIANSSSANSKTAGGGENLPSTIANVVAKKEDVSLTSDSELGLSENKWPENLLFWQLERMPRNVNYIEDMNGATLSDASLEIGIRVKHNVYGKGTVVGWRYSDSNNKSSGGGLRVGDTSGGLCSRGYARVLFDDITKGKWNVPCADCKIIGLAPLEIASYSLQWYDNSIDSLFRDTSSCSKHGLRPRSRSPNRNREGSAAVETPSDAITNMLIHDPNDMDSPSRSPSPVGRGRTPTRCLSPDARERRQRRRLLKKIQRISSWGDFLRRPHHKAFAICRAKERFIWGCAFGCRTQHDANILAIENCLSKKRPRENLVGEPWLIALDSVLYSFSEDTDDEGSPKRATQVTTTKTVVAEDGTTITLEPVAEDFTKKESFESLNEMSRASLRYRYLPSVAANCVQHYPILFESDVLVRKPVSSAFDKSKTENPADRNIFGEIASATPSVAVDNEKSGTTSLANISSDESATNSSTIALMAPKSLDELLLANRKQLRAVSFNPVLSSLRSNGPDLFEGWNDTLFRIIPLPDEFYDVSDPARLFPITDPGRLLFPQVPEADPAIHTPSIRYTISANNYAKDRDDGNMMEGNSKTLVLISWVDDDQENLQSNMPVLTNSANIDSFLNSLSTNGVNLLPQQDIAVALDHIRKAFASDDGLTTGGNNNGKENGEDTSNDGAESNSAAKEAAFTAAGNDESSNNFMPLGSGTVTDERPALMPAMAGLDWMNSLDETASEFDNASSTSEQPKNNDGVLALNTTRGGGPSRSTSKESNREILMGNNRTAPAVVVGGELQRAPAGFGDDQPSGFRDDLQASSSSLAQPSANSSSTPPQQPPRAQNIVPGQNNRGIWDEPLPTSMRGAACQNSCCPVPAGVERSESKDSNRKGLKESYSESSLYSMLQQSTRTVFLPSQVAGISGPGNHNFPCQTYTDDSIPELDDIYPYDFDQCKKQILMKWWPILVKKLIYYTNTATACGNSQNTRASSNKKLCDDLLLLLIKHAPQAIRQDAENIGNPLFRWMSLTTPNSMSLRPHRFMQIVDSLIKQGFGKEIARIGMKSMSKKWDTTNQLFHTIREEPEIPDISCLKKAQSWDELQKLVLDMVNYGNLLDDNGRYTCFELANADIAGYLLQHYNPEIHTVDSRMVTLLQNIITMSDTLPLVVLSEKKRNPHGMQLLQESYKLQVNESHEVNLEPWVSVSELGNRVIASKMLGDQYDEEVDAEIAGADTEARNEFSREYLTNCLDLVGSVIVSADLNYVDVLDFTIKTMLNHPVHLVAPSSRIRNVAQGQGDGQAEYTKVLYSPASMSPPMGPPSQPHVPQPPRTFGAATGSGAAAAGGDRAATAAAIAAVGAAIGNNSITWQDPQIANRANPAAMDINALQPPPTSALPLAFRGAAVAGVNSVNSNDNSTTSNGNAPTNPAYEQMTRHTTTPAGGGPLSATNFIGYKQFILSKTYGWQMAVRTSRDHARTQDLLVTYAAALNLTGHHIAINPAVSSVIPLTKPEKCLKLWYHLAVQQHGRMKVKGQVAALLKLAQDNWTAEKSVSEEESETVANKLEEPAAAAAPKSAYSTKIGESEAGDTKKARRSLNPITVLRKTIFGARNSVAPEKGAGQLSTATLTQQSSTTSLNASLTSIASNNAIKELANNNSAKKFESCSKVSTFAPGTTKDANVSGESKSPIHIESWCAEALFGLGYRPRAVLNVVDLQTALEDVYEVFQQGHDYKVGVLEDNWEKIEETQLSVIEFLSHMHDKLEIEIHTNSQLTKTDGTPSPTDDKDGKKDDKSKKDKKAAASKTIYNAQDRIWSVITEFPPGIPFALIWDHIGDFVFGKCKAYLGKSIFADNLFEEGVARLELKVNKNGRGCIWGGLTKRMAEGLAVQLYEAIPCVVEADPNSASKWGATIQANIMLRSLVHYTNGLGYVCDIAVQPEDGKGPAAEKKGAQSTSGVFPPQSAGVTPSGSSSNLSNLLQSPSGLSHNNNPSALGSQQPSSGIVSNNNSATINENSVNTDNSFYQNSGISAGNVSAPQSAANSATSHADKKKSWAISYGNATVTYTVCDIYTGEIMDGFWRTELDANVAKTKVSPVQGVMSAMELRREMSMASGFANHKNSRLLQLEASIFGPKDGIENKAGAMSGASSPTVPDTSSTALTKTPNTNTVSPDLESSKNTPTMGTRAARMASSDSHLDDPQKKKDAALKYKPIDIPLVYCKLDVDTNSAAGTKSAAPAYERLQNGQSLCQAVWLADTPYKEKDKQKMIYAHTPNVGSASKCVKIAAKIHYEVDHSTHVSETPGSAAILTSNSSQKAVIIPGCDADNYVSSITPASWPIFDEKKGVQAACAELGLGSQACYHTIELLRQICYSQKGIAESNLEGVEGTFLLGQDAQTAGAKTKSDDSDTIVEDLAITTNALDAKLKEQLSIPLLSVTRAGLPKWVFVLPQMCPTLFSVELKKNLLISSCFPLSFRVYWLQQDRFENRFGIRLAEAERKLQEAEWGNDIEGIQRAHDEIGQIEEESIRDKEIYIGKMKKELVRVEREHQYLMPMARALFSDKLDPNSSLEVIFKNESGFGPAVTQSFYSEVALALTNRKYALFVEDDSAAATDEFILGGRHGLVLRPDMLHGLKSDEEKEKLSLLRFLGRLIGRSLREGYRLPIQLSEAFFFMLQDHAIPQDWKAPKNLDFLPGPRNDGWSGRIVGAIYQYAMDYDGSKGDKKWKSYYGAAVSPPNTEKNLLAMAGNPNSPQQQTKPAKVNQKGSMSTKSANQKMSLEGHKKQQPVKECTKEEQYGSFAISEKNTTCMDETDNSWSLKYVQSGGKYSFQESVEAGGVCFTAYGTHGQPLVPNGDDIDLSMKNLVLFAEKIHKHWIVNTRKLYKEVREGLWEGLGCLDPAPSIWLRFFTAKELKTMFCGDNEITWTEEELRKYVQFHGWDEAIELEKRTQDVNYLLPSNSETPMAGGITGTVASASVGPGMNATASSSTAAPSRAASTALPSSALTIDNVEALNAATEGAGLTEFGSPRRNARRNEAMLTNLLNNDSEYNGVSTGSELDSEGEVMEVVSPVTFPQTPIHFLPSPKNGMPVEEEDFKMRRWLIRCLMEMNQKERQTFIEFCTSCPRLPVGGLKTLGLKVLPEQPGRILPRSRACANTLFLPDYPTRQEFEYHLKLALHDSMGQFEQE